jgi:hypothetical protein
MFDFPLVMVLPTHTSAAAATFCLGSCNFQALEGLLKQVLPVRVALQLRDSAAQQQQAQLPAALASPGSSRQAAAAGQPTQGTGGSSSGAGSSSSCAAAAAGQQQLQQQMQQQDDTAADEAANDSPWSAQPPRWQRQRQLRSRNPLLQQQVQQQQQQQQAQLPGQAIQQPRQQRSLQDQPQQQTVMESGSVLWPMLMFRQPQLEHAYRISACRQWQQWLDVLFLVLSLLSAVGGRLSSISSAVSSPVAALSVLLVAGVVLWGLLQQLLALPLPWYLRLRAPCIAAVRLLRVLLFCVEAYQLPAQVFRRPVAFCSTTAASSTAAGPASRVLLAMQRQLQQLLPWSQAEVAGCGILLMQGLAGQLPLVFHAAVQAAAAAALFGSLSVLTDDKKGAAAVAPMLVVAGQLLVGWLLPVLVVAVTEYRLRIAFLRRIR